MSYDYSKYYKKKSNEKKSNVEIRDKRDLVEAKVIDQIIFGILLAVIAILPLLTRTKIIDFKSPLITNSTIGSGTVGDVFTYYKFIFLVISTSIVLIIFLYRTFGVGIPLKKSFINFPLAILALFVTLSAVFAPYKTLALVGMYNRHEGAITFLCYFTLFFIAVNLTYTTKMLHKIVYALYPFAFVNAVLGLLGFYGIELINNRFVRVILMPSEITDDMITAGSRFITTINHGTYVSGISAVLVVIFMMMFILDQNKLRQTVNGLMTILSFAMLLTSLSRSGFLTFAMMLPIMAIMLVRSNEKAKQFGKLAAQLIVLGILFVVLVNHNPKVWDESMGMFIAKNPFVKEEQAVEEKINQAQTIESAYITGAKEDQENRSVVFNKETLYQYKSFAQDQLNKIKMSSHAFAEAENETLAPFQLPKLPDSGVGPGSGRLFIWENTFDLVKKRPLVGYGLDTFIYHFPQNDPDKIANLETHKVIVDKPHNLYINMLYGAGVIALLALLALLAMTFIKAVKTIIMQNFNDEKAILFSSLFIGWLAYLVQALFNDSIIGTAPVFWIVFGVIVTLLKFSSNHKTA